MHFDEIETFLAVVEYGNIARAASMLHIGQGTASTRIRQLEEALGIQLFFRHKGIKTVSLTPEGEYFQTIAQQCVSLWQQANQIKNRLIFKELRIAAIDTLNRYYFVDLYRDFMRDNPEITFFLQTEHSTEIHQLIESQQIDVGFAYQLHKSPNVAAYPLFREKSVILYHRGHPFALSGNLRDLAGKDEIYSTYGSDFDLWHRRAFPCEERRKITVGTFSMVPSFLDDPMTWTIIHQSLADMLLKQDESLDYTPIVEDPPPVRTAYVLFYKYPKPWIRELTELFLSGVVNMIRRNPALELLYHGEGEA